MRPKITIVGGGACALMLGCELDISRYDVAIYERNPAPARKFLVAGEGGLNLTHSEAPGIFIQRYTPAGFLQEPFSKFSNTGLVAWLHQQGIDTRVGSSGRVFPQKGWKPVEVLNVLLKKIKDRGIPIHTRHAWQGFSEDNGLLMEHAGRCETLQSDLVIFCLGGASWPVTGSRGDWADHFKNKGISVLPFEPSNCSYAIAWPPTLLPAIEGKALKNCVISCGNRQHAGEVVLTKTGMEGSGIYPLSPQIRQQLHNAGTARISIDMKPSLSQPALLKKLHGQDHQGSYSRQVAQKLNLNTLHMALLKQFLSKEAFLDPKRLVEGIKSLDLEISGTGPLNDAISTVGGIALQEVDQHFQLKKLPGHFALGEMLDFDAPTGGYLLQAAFTMAYDLATQLNKTA